MSRTQDIVLARVRMVAQQWWGTEAGGAVNGTGAVGVADVAEPRPAGPADLDHAAVGTEPAGTEPAGTEPAGTDEPPAGGGAVPRTWLLLAASACAVALVVAGGVAVRGWPRAQPPPGAAAAAPQDLRPLDAPSPSPSVVVHVAGEVRDPGVVTLPAGARVADAVRAAGGLRRGGHLGPTNLARVLADGERIEVGSQAVDAAGGPAGAPGAAVGAGPVDLNTATAAQLDALPGIGPVTAAKILAWRAEHGRFSVVDELAEVPGIGPKTLEDLRPLVRA